MRTSSRRPSELPWQARARAAAQRFGVDPRYLRRLRWLHKARTVRRDGGRIGQNLGFVLLDPETDNFTYEIANQPELVRWVAAVAGCELEAAQRFVAEPGQDQALAASLRDVTANRWLWTKPSPAFGKRLGWYALVRALRPGLIVETGVHDGLGSLLLLHALRRNLAEGAPGRLVSFDVNPTAGWIVGEDPLWDLQIRSSEEGLPEALTRGVDMFIYDGWHSYADERRDLELAAARLAPEGTLISDDAQVTRALEHVCRELDFSYREFAEVPVGHFYPGAVLAAGRRRPQ